MDEKVKITVTGDSKQIDLLIRESKVKIARGLLEFGKVIPHNQGKPQGNVPDKDKQ